MIPTPAHIASKSFAWYRRSVVYQVLIIAVLSAVITGSLLTGGSVRSSLKSISSERLGNTGILVTSGLRYFNPELQQRLGSIISPATTALLESTGSCQSMTTQVLVPDASVYIVDSSFFSFHGIEGTPVGNGSVAINGKLASRLGVREGDEIIIRIPALSDIPADAPFAPEKETGISFVRRIGLVLDETRAGNFSLSISQLVPDNIFISRYDLDGSGINSSRANRILIAADEAFPADSVYSALERSIRPSDIGLRIRTSANTGDTEITSDRIFLDEAMIGAITGKLPGAKPLITYLLNSIVSGKGLMTPYSFASALPPELYGDVSGEGLVINRWLSEDTGTREGDSLEISWYAPDSLNSLVTRTRKFRVLQVADMAGIYADSLLMPEFPGIAGSESCSRWDAGVPVDLGSIRDKDEEYWNMYGGTPKVFMNYGTGAALWGNNFGPATALRLPPGYSAIEAENELTGSIEPSAAGIRLQNILEESVRAAEQGVDFSTLFLSLGFFMILSALLLLYLSVSTYFDSKKDQLRMFISLGFPGRLTYRIFMSEASLVAAAGSAAGALAGYIVNIAIIWALNNVWRGAVQVNTLEPHVSASAILGGVLSSFLVVFLLMHLHIRRFTGLVLHDEKERSLDRKKKINAFYPLLLSLAAAITLMLSFVFEEAQTGLAFVAGGLLFGSLLFLSVKYMANDRRAGALPYLSGSYYSFLPYQAAAPVLFIAAGIFAVFITGANRMSFSDSMLSTSGGAGAYLLWGETSLPLDGDINSEQVRRNLGLDEEEMDDLRFVQAKKLAGNDASCLNLNHITAPPLLGLNPAVFAENGSFSFAKSLKEKNQDNPWLYLEYPPVGDVIYGIADQTVIQWGLQLAIGDTIVMRAENGRPLKIVLAGGLESSVFQGHLLIGSANFTRYFPSVAGYSVFLAGGDHLKIDAYSEILNARLENSGLRLETTASRLESFYQVTNTYLSVFTVFGAFGMITGVAGLGFILLRTYSRRKREFALLLASGFTPSRIRAMILREQAVLLAAGILTGVLSAAVATYPSVSGNPDMPWKVLALMIAGIVAAGTTALYFSTRNITAGSLASSLRRE